MSVDYTPATTTRRTDPAGAGIGPSWFPRVVLRRLVRYLNPLILRRAGSTGFEMAAQVRHVGRRSGKTYTTPVTVRQDGNHVMIGLAFGNQSDWARNVLAAGRCSMLIDGAEYEATEPHLIDMADAQPFMRSLYTRFERFMLRHVLGIRQFMRLTISQVAQAADA